MFSTNKQKHRGKLLPHEKARCFSGNLLVFFKRRAKERRQIELPFLLRGNFFPGYYETSTGLALSPSILQMSFSAGFCLFACSEMQIGQFRLQLKELSPVSAVVVYIVLFLLDGSGH